MMPPSPSKPSASRIAAERRGRKAEVWAALYLRARLYGIVQTRLKTPVGEIDIVAKKGATLVFVEVKQRTSARDAKVALEAVNIARIRRAAEWFIMTNPKFSGADCRFDVIAIAPGRWPYHLQNAF